MHSSQTQIRVRYEETDQMGVVYHAKYFHWFEVARIHFLDEIGHPYKELEENGYFLPVLECSASFKQAAHFDDKLIIETEVSFPSMLKLSAEYKVVRNHSIIANGKTVHAFVSKEGKVMRPPSSFVEVMRQNSD